MSEQEVRMVPMQVAGTFSKGGLKLVPVASSHREAWEAALTGLEAQALLTFTDQTWNATQEVSETIERAYDKLYEIADHIDED